MTEYLDRYPTMHEYAEGKRINPKLTDLISRADAMGAVQDHFNADGFKGYDDGQKMMDRIKALPSADAEQTDCTDFVNWLTEVVMDEGNWEYNSVAYGEIICRKLEKLGVLEVTEEPSYYIRPSANAVQGEWKHTITWQPYCSNCEYVFGEDEEFSPFWKYCPMCGVRKKGAEHEID